MTDFEKLMAEQDAPVTAEEMAEFRELHTQLAHDDELVREAVLVGRIGSAARSEQERIARAAGFSSAWEVTNQPPRTYEWPIPAGFSAQSQIIHECYQRIGELRERAEASR